MQYHRYGVVLAGLALSVASGCGSSDPRTSNQGGGTIISAGIKVTQQQLSTLTADEVQILADYAATQNPGIPSLTDDQADMIVQFMDANDIDTFNDVSQILAQFQSNPASVVLPDGFLQIFVSLLSGGATT